VLDSAGVKTMTIPGATRPRVKPSVPLVFLMIAVLLGISGCSGRRTPPPSEPSQHFYVANDADVAPGTLLTSSPNPTVDVRISRAHSLATSITYRSTSGLDGSSTTVTGAVFTPLGTPPLGGWPVVVYGHPGAGILENCAPSRQSNLFGNGAPIESLLHAGYLVVMTDYEGIGSKGPHPYLEPKTLGYNMIDAVRAARQLNYSAGTRWAAYGISEGGEAAWAAAELAPSYGQGLDMVAAVALNPTADMSGLPQTAFEGKLTAEQLSVMLYIANTVAALNPDVHRDDYVHGYTRDHNDALLGCSGRDLYIRVSLADGMSSGDLAPVSTEAADRLSAILRYWSLPGLLGIAKAPVLVMAGLVNPIVSPGSTAAAVQRACANGEQITWLPRKAEGQDDLSQRPALTWLGYRFKGSPVDEVVAPLEGVVCNVS
jgi:pimeloyl-ACP methyl ester carboxylesterase